ncbi:Retrovirus Pol polyprotein from transposon 17.6 [Paragonimus kellicotti]|nr:Retrovirus Pol polyprotein from transposon 17.6 [Paragonimus kellicotti]
MNLNRVSRGVIKPDSEAVSPPKELLTPKNTKSQRRAVSDSVSYSQWIANLSDKISSPIGNPTSRLPEDVMVTFEDLKQRMGNVVSVAIKLRYTLITAAPLNRNSRRIAIFSGMPSPTEFKHPAVEKEAYAIVEASKVAFSG